MRAKSALVACLTLVVATPVVAQRPDSMTGELSHTFREVTAVRELADGRALVLDSHDRFVYLADFRAGTVQRVGEQGWEDRQYLWPSRLLTIPGDSILIWDAIEGRMHVLTDERGSLDVRKSIPKSALGVSGGASFTPVMSDALGRLYRQEPHAGRVIVARLNETRSVVDTILNVSLTRDAGSQLFSSYSRWTVDPSGRVAHVLVKPYRVDLYAPDGMVITGADIQFVPTAVTPAVQKAWLEVLHRPRIVWASQAGGRPGFVEVDEPQVVYGAWPLVMPPVVGRSFVGFAGDGSLIIERLALPGLPSEYDVIDEQARLKDRFELPAGTRIVATGRGVVYVTVRGPDSRLKLQRFTVRGPR